MTNGLELTKLAPRFHEDQVLHVVNTPLSPLVHILTRYGFSVIVIDGLKITDRKGFFEQVKIAFQFPDYFGRNWDAWIDCLRDFEDSLHGNTAVIWDNADHTIGLLWKLSPRQCQICTTLRYVLVVSQIIPGPIR